MVATTPSPLNVFVAETPPVLETRTFSPLYSILFEGLSLSFVLVLDMSQN
jgi:hypothetical protein